MDKQVLSKATAATEDPTAGWMFHSIAKMTKESPTACENVIDWLMNRLNDNNIHTKKKVLIIIKNVAQQGDSDFARLLTKKTETIKSYASYRGPSDPLHGDSLNQAVRVAAQQAVEAIFERNESGDRNKRMYEGMDSSTFNNNPTPTSGGITSWLGYGRDSSSNDGYVNSSTTNNTFTSGIGSHSYTSGSGQQGTFGGGGGKYQGIGNPNMAQPSTNNQGYYETIKGYVTPTINTVSTGVTSIFTRNNKPYGNDGASFLETDPSMGTYQVPVVPTGFQNQRTSNNNTYGGGSGNSGWDPSPNSPVNSGDSNTLEYKLVDDFTSVSGVKLQPTRTEISQFVSKCAKVDLEAISELLHKKLKHKQWQVRLKSLCAIEALLRANQDTVFNYFVECYNEIGEYTEAVQDSVASKAKRIIKLLDAEEVDDDDSSSTPKQRNTPVTPIEFEAPPVQVQEPVRQKIREPTPPKVVRQQQQQLIEEPPQRVTPSKTVVTKQPTPKQKELSPIFDPFEDEPEPEPELPPQPTGPKPITSIDDIFEGMSIKEDGIEFSQQVQTQQQPQQPERKRADSAALMNDIGRFFDQSQQGRIASPNSPSNPQKNLQQYPPSTLHQQQQPQIVYVPVPMPQMGVPMGMQPMMSVYPMQQMGAPMGVYPVQMSMGMQQRIIPQQKNTVVSPQSRGFDFMNKGVTGDEGESDSHFDFVKQEIAQSTRK